MAAYRRVYDSRHLQAGTLRSVIEYGLPLRFYCLAKHCSRNIAAFHPNAVSYFARLQSLAT